MADYYQKLQDGTLDVNEPSAFEKMNITRDDCKCKDAETYERIQALLLKNQELKQTLREKYEVVKQFKDQDQGEQGQTMSEEDKAAELVALNEQVKQAQEALKGARIHKKEW
mmetsp:Transcript_12904/g.17735  ORF Transcript_12904/g.17735 Transcript_12904/m.17735 type:complete len:112 (-) Transcript_12904:182-517(-)